MAQTLPSADAAVRAHNETHQLTGDRCAELAVIFKALGDPVRLHLFNLIAASAEPLCVCHIPAVGVSQPTVSHHLRKLREAGLIDSERRGTWVHYWATDVGRRYAAHVQELAA